KEDGNKNIIRDGKQHVTQLEKQIEELHRTNEENIRLKNVEKFAAAGRMARSLAHEIRNPLTNIGLALEQLGSELPQNEDANLLVEMISRNTMRINQLITDLINSTKFAQLVFSKDSIKDILEEVIEGAEHFAANKNIAINTEFAPHLPLLFIDRDKIKTAFENLITHSIEAVQQTEGKIVITTANENNKCVITVQNNGAAISNEKIERLFEPHLTNKQGSGLSLTHTQNIILNHGGSIYVESEQGKGTVFTVILEFA
ncbi:MAG: ATP-binding protein, partial [Bacteroidota bacterium]|nr:ATP-binding protein [Bacteroidota bacterium]